MLFQVALPRQDDVDSTEGLTATLNEIAAGLDRRWTGARPRAIGVLPETVTPADLDDAVRRVSEAAVERDSPQMSGAPVGLTELTLDPAALDFNLHDGHVLILGEPGSGRTEALRTAAHALRARYAEHGVQTMVVDLRRHLADLRLADAVSYVARPPEITAAMEELRAECVERINAEAPDRSPIIVLVDDYDLIAGVGANPLAPLGDIIFQGRDSHIHVVLARTTINSARLGTDPVIARMLEAGASALLLSGDPNEGPLVRGIRAQPLPAGRAIVVRRRGQPSLIQLALMNSVAADSGEMIHQSHTTDREPA